MKTPLRVAIYARRSTKSEDRQVRSIPRQLDCCNEIISRLKQDYDIQVVDTITERESAKKPGRKGFQKLCDLINKRQIDAVVTWRLHRLARNPIDGGFLTYALLQQQILGRIFTETAAFDKYTNAIVIQVEFGMATQEIIELSSRIKSGIRDNFENGFYPLSAIPIGYRRIKKSLIEPDEQAFLVKKLFELYLYKDFSVYSLAAQMRKMGLKTRKGRPVTKSSVEKILKNPIYSGITRWRKKDGTEYFRGKHKAVITRKMWEDCQDKLAGKRPGGSRGSKVFAFTKKISCSCGWKLSEYVTKGNYYLECKNPECGRNFNINGKNRKTIRSQYLIDAFLDIFKNIQISEHVSEKITQEFKKYVEKNEDERQKNFSELQTRLRKLLVQESNIRQDRIDRVFSQEEYLAEKNKIQEQKQSILDQLAETNDDTDELIEKFMKISELIFYRFQNSDEEMRRDYFELLFQAIEISQNSANIELTGFGYWIYNLPNFMKENKNFEPSEVSNNDRLIEVDLNNSQWYFRGSTVRTFSGLYKFLRSHKSMIRYAYKTIVLQKT